MKCSSRRLSRSEKMLKQDVDWVGWNHRRLSNPQTSGAMPSMNCLHCQQPCNVGTPLELHMLTELLVLLCVPPVVVHDY